MSRVLGRRTFLGVVTAAGGTISGLVLFGRKARRLQELSVTALLDGIANSQDAQRLGVAYLHLYPDQADIDVLREELTLSLGKPSDETLREAIANDFGLGRTLQIDGWVLSETELKACALAVLQSSSSIKLPETTPAGRVRGPSDPLRQSSP